MIHIRDATNNDSNTMFHLHLSSILFYCANHYPKAAIDAWLDLKKPEHYRTDFENYHFIVAEENQILVGFGLLNIEKKSIDSLYLKPMMSGKGIGAKILEKLESLAMEHNITELSLSSTLNAIDFYHHMGYVGSEITTYRLSSGIDLKCVNMTKRLIA